jgi:2',3'-cyclic-nucleotide 2'-phosphodiesterase (5'-nucleotidase family)
VLSSGYVDIVFEGHSHYSYVLRDAKGVYHLQNSGDNGGISHAELEYNFANGKYSVTTAEHVRSSVYSEYEDSPIVAQLLEKYKDVVGKADEVLGTNSTVKDPDRLRDIIAELYFDAGVERWGDQYDIVLGGGYMSAREPGYLHAGTIVYGDLQQIFPFDNELVLCSVKGSDLKKKFINTTNSDYFIYGSYNVNDIKDNQIYYIVTDTYTSTYSYNNLTEIERSTDGLYARDLVADFIRKGGWS